MIGKKQKRFVLALAILGIGIFVSVHGRYGNAQAVTQGYSSDTQLEIGMIVQLDDRNTSKIDPVTQDTADKAHGVVVALNDAPVALSNNNGEPQFFVATSGKYKVLVSDQNKAIHKNDYVGISSLAGVGMKADGTQTTVIGRSLTDFTGTTSVQGTTTLKDSAGKTHTVHLGYVIVDVEVAHNPLQKSTEVNIPGFLKHASEAVANKPVSYIRVYMGLGIVLLSAIIAGSVLYSGVRNGMVSVGRNPLARSSIMRSLLQVILVSVIIFLLGIFAVYLLLKL